VKRFYVTFAANLIFAGCLVFLTMECLHVLRSASHSDLFGWLDLTLVGPVASVALMLTLLLLLTADALWVLFFILWLLKKRLHIDDKKPKNRTLYLP
jgi:hypothetical protein